jgi:galactokinase
MSPEAATAMSDATQRACDLFQSTYGRPPYWIASAPGRLNLIGEFTDYNNGFVLPMAIECRTAIAATPNASNQVVLKSDATGETARFELSDPWLPDGLGRWSNYPKGVMAGFRRLGAKPRGFDAVIHSSVPMGAGLSSSAALAASMATLLEAAWDFSIDPVQKALLCQKAEHEYAQVPCGIMDPFISILGRAGHVLLLDCRFNEPSWIALNDDSVSVLVINTNIRHRHAGGQYTLRRRSCEAAARALAVTSLREASLDLLDRHAFSMDAMSLRCARHVIGEIERTLAAAQCVRVGDWPALGRLMDQSHESLRGDYDVSCPELEAVVEIAGRIGPEGGVLGCRLTGGGFGGCAVALIRSDARDEVVAEIEAGYRQRTGIDASLFVSRPAAGAALMEL